MEIKNSEMETDFSENSENILANYTCNICDYICSKKQHMVQHLKTKRHFFNNEILVSKNGNNLKPEGEFDCECGKQYTNKSGLWKHKKKCNYGLNKNSEPDKVKKFETNEPTTKEIIDLMRIQMLENQELRKIMLSQQQQIIELASKTSITNTNTNTNCNNNSNNTNTFNLNMFLNEKCKDAINISEFVDNVKIQLSDLENFGHMGYVEGVSQILINNLKDLDTYSRPIHCSDLKREVLYIKDNNEWTKETDDKPVLKSAIKRIANKNIKQIQTWKDENPGCCDSESKKNDQYLKIVSNAMNGLTKEETEKNYDKIISKIAKETVIQKNII
jgi:hypothetical protein